MTKHVKRLSLSIAVALVATAAFASGANAAPSDFDNDGRADLLWHNKDTGLTQIWYLNDDSKRTGFAYATDLAGVPLVTVGNWQPAGVIDFNADGHPDILWHNGSSGVTQVWYMNNAVRTSFAEFTSNLATPNSTGWQVVATADFDQNGRADVLWHNGSSGFTQVWYMDGVNRVGAEDVSHNIPGLNVKDSSGWRLVGVGQFNPNVDNFPDFVWHNGVTGETQVWFMNRMTHLGSVSLSIGGSIPAASVPDSSGWKIAGVYDFNRDGKPDVLWRNGITGISQVWFMNGTARSSFADLVEQNNAALIVPDSSGWRIAEGTNDERLMVSSPQPMSIPMAPYNLTYIGLSTNPNNPGYVVFRYTDNTPIDIVVNHKVYEVVNGNTYLRVTIGNSGAAGGTREITIHPTYLPLSNPTTGCLRISAFNASGESALSNVACISRAAPPTGPILGLGNGVLIASPDLTNMSFLPHIGDSFRVWWQVCNAGTAAGTANVVLTETRDVPPQVPPTPPPPWTFPSLNVPANTCLSQTSIVLKFEGYVNYELFLNGVRQGGNGMLF